MYFLVAKQLFESLMVSFFSYPVSPPFCPVGGSNVPFIQYNTKQYKGRSVVVAPDPSPVTPHF